MSAAPAGIQRIPRSCSRAGAPLLLENRESPAGASRIFLMALPAFPREIKLRNYDPEDEELKKRKLPPAKPASVEETVKEQLEAAKPEPIIDEVVGTAGIPGNPEDLKRDVSKKLEKLEKRTQRAIAELIRILGWDQHRSWSASTGQGSCYGTGIMEQDWDFSMEQGSWHGTGILIRDHGGRDRYGTGIMEWGKDPDTGQESQCGTGILARVCGPGMGQ
uniref:Coiled-coil domain containing 12 n=1 Tax=Cyanistes caeruleus TaxID=156563 RepID=A0A8C0ZBE3_CYACU